MTIINDIPCFRTLPTTEKLFQFVYYSVKKQPLGVCLKYTVLLIPIKMSGTEELPSFAVVDYLIFGISLAAALAIGIYFAYVGRQDGYRGLITAPDISVFPIILSLVASFLSGILILGEFEFHV